MTMAKGVSLLPDCEMVDSTLKNPTPLDFISAYAHYADVLEVPRRVHEVVGGQLLVAILNRNGVRIPHGSLTYTLDSWTAILSTSGVGRSTLVNLVHPLLEGAGLKGIVRSQQWGSVQALYQSFAQNPSGLCIWGELSERLKQLNDRNFGAAKQWLANLYDNSNVPEPITYAETGHKSKDTPAIIFNSAPRTNILATSSNEWFFANVGTGDSSGGFLPRWTLISIHEPVKDVPTPKAVDSSMQHELIEFLKKVSDIKGEADLSAILPDYAEWYTMTKRRFEAQPHKALASAYFNRHRVHALKLAVVFEVACSLTLNVSFSAWQRAKLEAQQLEETIFHLLPTGMSPTGYAVSQAEDMIEQAADGLFLWEYTRAFQHVQKREREDWLHTLCASGRVVRFVRASKVGRRPCVLVHVSNLSKYRIQHTDGHEVEG